MAQQYMTHSDTPPIRRGTPWGRWGVPRVGWGLALVEAVIGYEWLISGLNKLLNPQFRYGLAHMLQEQFKNNPNEWWINLMKTLVLPQAQLWAAAVQIGELLIALAYFAGVYVWLSGRLRHATWVRWLNGAVIVGLLGGVLLSVNYYVMAGDTVPGVDPGKAFQEGISIDGMATLLALALIVAHLLAQRTQPRSRRTP